MTEPRRREYWINDRPMTVSVSSEEKVGSVLFRESRLTDPADLDRVLELCRMLTADHNSEYPDGPYERELMDELTEALKPKLAPVAKETGAKISRLLDMNKPKEPTDD